MTDPISDAAKNFGILSTLEKSIEARVFLLMFNFIMFVDCGITIINKFGIQEFAFGQKSFDSGVVAQLVIIFMMFSFFMSVFMPFTSGLSFFILSGIIDRVHDFLRAVWHAVRTDNEIRIKEKEREQVSRARVEAINELRSGYVHLHKLREKAHKGKETYYLSMYDQGVEVYSEALDAARKTSLYSFSAFYICVLNVLLNLRQDLTSFTGYILIIFNEDGHVYVFAVLTLLLIVAYKSITEIRTPKVYCPSFAKELEEDLQKNFDQEREYEEKIRKNLSKGKDKDSEQEF